MTERLQEGWYLMSTADLEQELARHRDPARDLPASNAVRLSLEDALAYRNAGNVPDDKDRTLRLVLHIDSADDLARLDSKRLLYEPDYHDAPAWRREGSRPVNVVPLRAPGMPGTSAGPWWKDARLAELEREWSERGTVAGLKVPGEYRGFVYKTVLALRSSGRDISVESVVASISRWLPADEAERIWAALTAANRLR